MPLADHFATIELGNAVDDLTRQLLDELAALLDRVKPKKLDRSRSTITNGIEGISIELRHLDDPDLAVDIEAFGEEVVVNYGEEHEHFNVEHEYMEFVIGPFAAYSMVPRVISFLEALITGRIELHVSHRLIYVSTDSYWINDQGERERFLNGGTVIPTFRWTKEPIVRTFDFR